MTAGEWALLHEGLLTLRAELRAEIRAGIEAMVEAEPPLVCPMLDRDAGACRVYEHRPSDCRTYGFFASRSRDLWCRHIDAAVEAAGGEPPTWGNQSAVERRLVEAFGPRRPLPEWIADDPELTPPPRPRRSS